MKNKQKNNKKIFLILILLVVLIISAIILVKAFYQSTKTYHSNFLKISIDYPSNFELEEKFGLITLKEKNTYEFILVNRIGTNNNSIEGFLFDLTDKNKILISNKKIININGHEFVSVTIKHPLSKIPDTKVYYFYSNNFIYDISTKYPKLFDDLDQIVKSFRYTP